MSSYTFNAGDYAARTGHLEPLEDLAYRRMLDQCHLREVLPEGAAEVARLIRMRSNVAEVQAVLSEFFTRQIDGWTHAGTATKPAKAKRGSLPTVPPSALESVGFSAEVAREFVAYKQAKKAPLTERAWADHCREADKAGFTPQQAAEKVMAKGWRGFEATYVARDRPVFGTSAQPGGLVTMSQHGLQTMRAAEALEKRLFGGMDAAA